MTPKRYLDERAALSGTARELLESALEEDFASGSREAIRARLVERATVDAGVSIRKHILRLVAFCTVAVAIIMSGTSSNFSAGGAPISNVSVSRHPRALAPTSAKKVTYEETSPAPLVRVEALPDAPREKVKDASPAVERSSLERELNILDEARGAISAGRASDALQRLDAYAREFPKGLLGEEAAMLLVEALHANGDTTEAKARAERLIHRSSSSPYAARARTILMSD